jgi:hypothetical protein
MYQACRDLFCSFDPTVAHNAMVSVLKKRGNSKRLHEFIVSVPNSLKAVSLSCKLTSAQQTNFLKLLDAEIGACFTT